jgi:dTDP-4-dehydrorhamnose 3,5-epimerase
MRKATTISDHRGTVCEIYDTRWNLFKEPVVFVYQVTIRPKQIKGWVVHRNSADRTFVSQGTIKFVLYDDRPESPTYKMLNVHYLSEYERGFISIPAGVFHALENVGETDALFINMPTKGYDHADPDKHRLPLENDVIPYSFIQAAKFH